MNAGGAEFDPLREWGEPQQLPLPPSPTPADTANQAASGDKAAAKPAASSAGDKKKTIAKVNICRLSCRNVVRLCNKPTLS